MFHGPVRNGKVWCHVAMVARRSGLYGVAMGCAGVEFRLNGLFSVWKKKFVWGLIALGLQGYRVKPYGQLVLVSLTHYCASTPSLSTLWSSTTLQGGQASGRSHLQASFTLRCFQRLSLPHIATRRYHWRDNRYTRGASTPVLSY